MNPKLAALVVHDLKNELGALEAALELSIDAPSLELARRHHAQCGQLRRHLVQFLTLYAQQDGLRALAADESPMMVLTSAARDATQARPDLSITVQDDGQSPPYWYFDLRLVRMALDAALHNAIRFARNQITLQALNVSGGLALRIDDDGPGPDPNAHDAQAATATGLGTELCQSVALAHAKGALHGHVSLGYRPGGGARFELWLP